MQNCRIVLTMLLCAACAPAQESRATISGTVTDSSSAVVVGASIKLLNKDTGVAFAATSNSTGQYRFLFLNPGNYQITAEQPDFKSFVRDQIEIHVSQSATIDISLQVGAAAETISASSEVPLLDSEKVDRGLVVDLIRIFDPLTGRFEGNN